MFVLTEYNLPPPHPFHHKGMYVYSYVQSVLLKNMRVDISIEIEMLGFSQDMATYPQRMNSAMWELGYKITVPNDPLRWNNLSIREPLPC